MVLGQLEQHGEGLVAVAVVLFHEDALGLADHRPRLQRLLQLSRRRRGVVADAGEDDAGKPGEGAGDPGAVVAEGMPVCGVEVEGADARGRRSAGPRRGSA